MVIEILVFLLVVLAAFYISLQYILYQPDYKTNVYKLSSESPVTDLPTYWNESRASTQTFFVFLMNTPRNTTTLDCSAQLSYIPGCSPEPQQATKCSAAGCATELNTLQKTYLQSLYGIGAGSRNSMQLFVQGDISSNSAQKVPAYIAVVTQRDTGTSFIEGVPLPAIPLQRWTMITIRKDTKRIDVFYNKERVASKLLEYLPLTSGAQQTFVGNPSLQGVVGFMNSMEKTLSPAEIAALYDRMTNTKGVPRALDETNIDWNVQVKLCAFGSCNPMPMVVPQDPFVIWDSPYN